MKKDANCCNESVNSFPLKVAEEGIVLLKNDDNILPFKNKKFALFGAAQMENFQSDKPWLYLLNSFEKNGLNFDMDLANDYKNWAEENSTEAAFRGNIIVQREFPEEMTISHEMFERALKNGAETAMIIISRVSSENCDMSVKKGDYMLSDSEEELITNICKYFKNIVVILKIGCCMDLSFLDNNKIKGVLYTNNFGEGTADALSRILKGHVCPSGRLTYTMAKHFNDYPSSPNFGQQGGGLIQDYKEDIFVGYRYFETFDNKNVVFPFGYGLSYTDFEITDIKFEKLEKIKISATVKNIGNCPGKEVVQLYFSAPAVSEGAKLSKPSKELCGFEKTELLYPGESETVNFEIETSQLASYDDTGILGEKSVWILEKGKYRFFIGKNIANTMPVGEYSENENRIIRKCTAIDTTLPERLLADGTYEKLPINNSDGPLTVVSALEKTCVDIKRISKLKSGESINLKLFAGVGGGYKLKFSGNDCNKKISDLISVKINSENIKLSSDDKGETEIFLPLKACNLTITACCNNPHVETLCFEKIDTSVTLKGDKLTVIKGSDYYESSFGTEVANYYDDETNKSESYFTNFCVGGMNTTFKISVPEGGIYDISFRYCYGGKTTGVNNIMTLAVSNIVQPLGNIVFEKTQFSDENKKFKNTDSLPIELPAGTVYLKLIAVEVPFPNISEIRLVKSKNKTTGTTDAAEITKSKKRQGNPPGMLEPDNGVRSGITLKDVYNNKALMPEFIKQLSNRELATVVSGTSLNKTPYGDVGCNHPLYLRGIPAAQTADGPGGLRQQGVRPVAYPSPLILSCSFNKKLYAEYGKTLGQECERYGVDLWLAPSINIFRNPCCGRNHSYASEDPYLSGIFAANQIKAVQSLGIGAVLKHYCANNTEFKRLKSNSRVSERALREIYIYI